MPTRRTRGSVSNPCGVALVALALAITAGAALAGSSRTSRDPERISVTAVSGDVSVTMAGAATTVQPDSTVGLPAHIVTGDDGMLGLTQAGTKITIAADSDIEIPAEAADGQLIARLVQRRGNVFYDVAHRDVGTLRVETPFLVAVIKGTQFNVAVQDGSTAISLFQGRLEIRTPDGSDSIQLNAGEIAIRTNVDDAIRVLDMNENRVEVPRAGSPVAARIAPEAAANANAARAVLVPVGPSTRDAPAVAAQTGAPSSSTNGADFVLPAQSLVANAGSPTMQIDSNVGLAADGGRAPPTLGAAVDLGAALPLVAASLGSSANVGAGGSNVSLGAGVGVGGASASLGANLGVGTGSSGISLGAGTTLNTGGAGASLNTNLNVGASSPSASLGANANLGSASLGATVTLGGGASTGLLGTGVNVGLDLGNTGSGAAPPATAPSATAPPAAPVTLPSLSAVTLPTLPAILPQLPTVSAPVIPPATSPAPAKPAPPLLGAIGKLLGHP